MGEGSMFTRAPTVFIVILTLGFALPALGCGGATGASSEQARLAPTAPAANVAHVTAGETAFAFDLFRALRSGDVNLAFSPYSAYLALAMTYAGARGDTERQMARVLATDISQEAFHPTLNTLDQSIRQSIAVSMDKGRVAELRTANSVWAEEELEFVPGFLDLLAQDYGAGIHLAPDLSSEESRRAINRWASEETGGAIPELVPPGALATASRVGLVLVNALSLSAPWQNPFDPQSTQPGSFHLVDGSDQQVQMMGQHFEFGYAQEEAYRAVELPFVGNRLSMLLILPAEGTFTEFADALDDATIATVRSALERTLVAVSMPRFRLTSHLLLREALQELGMSAAFKRELADFIGITEVADGMWIDQVLQSSEVTVDEGGVQASAGTAALLTVGGISDDAIVLDRPFLYLIQDDSTGAILFLGQVVDPAAG